MCCEFIICLHSTNWCIELTINIYITTYSRIIFNYSIVLITKFRNYTNIYL